MKEKILHVSCGGLGHGGVSAVIFSIVQTLYKQFEFDCVVFKKKLDKEEQFQRYGKLFRINAYNDNGKRQLFELLTRPLRLYRGVYKICKENKYQVIHCHNMDDEGVCLLAAKNAGVPVRIAHSHNTPSPRKLGVLKKIQSYINRMLMSKFATVRVGCSKAACQSFFGTSDFRVILNSVDLTRFKISNRRKHDGVIFIHVGRYTYQKNQNMVIQVFNKIHEKIPDSRLFLVGYGEDEQKIRNKIVELGLELFVELIPGERVDVSKMYSISDYMIFPSFYEGFGIVLIEAQAMGIPCFVSETIQKEADVGLLKYIKLDLGVDVWADTILDYIKKDEKVDVGNLEIHLNKYCNETIGKQYALIYKG